MNVNMTANRIVSTTQEATIVHVIMGIEQTGLTSNNATVRQAIKKMQLAGRVSVWARFD